MAVHLNETDERRALRQAAEERLRTAVFIDVPTLALATGNAQRVIRDAIADGTIKSVRMGRSIRIPAAPLRKEWGIS